MKISDIENKINREQIKRADYIFDMSKQLKRFKKIKKQKFLRFRTLYKLGIYESSVRMRRKYPHNEAIKVENITLTQWISALYSSGSLSSYLLYQVSRHIRVNCILVNFMGPEYLVHFALNPSHACSPVEWAVSCVNALIESLAELDFEWN